MTTLLLAFAVSTLMVVWCAGSSNPFARFLFASAAVGVMAVTAGARDLDVGTDMEVYGNETFRRVARAPDWESALHAAESVRIEGEHGYVWLNYAVSRFTDDPHVFYFWLSVVTCGTVLIAVLLFRQTASAPLMWLVFLCTAYAESFNLLRQSAAMAFVLLGIVLVLRRRTILAFVAVLTGVMFHLSALIGFAALIAALLVMRSKKRPLRAAFFVAGATLLLTISFSFLLESLGSVLEETKYSAYLTADAEQGISLGMETLYRLLPIVVGLFVYAKRSSEIARRSSVREVPELVGPASVSHPPASHRHTTASVHTTPRDSAPTTGLPTKATSPSSAPRPELALLLILLMLLLIELLLLPIREISYPMYRLPMYFGYARILAYAAVAAYFTTYRKLAVLGVAGFALAYFYFLVIQRTGLEYHSELLSGIF